MIIREGKAKDISLLIKLAKLTLNEELEASGLDIDRFSNITKIPLLLNNLSFKLLQRLAEVKIKFFIALENKNLIGFILFYKEKRLWLAGLSVHPFYRKKNLGKDLLMFGLKQLQNKEDIYLDVLSHKSNLISFYQNAGFKVFNNYCVYLLDLDSYDFKSQNNKPLLFGFNIRFKSLWPLISPIIGYKYGTIKFKEMNCYRNFSVLYDDFRKFSILDLAFEKEINNSLLYFIDNYLCLLKMKNYKKIFLKVSIEDKVATKLENLNFRKQGNWIRMVKIYE